MTTRTLKIKPFDPVQKLTAGEDVWINPVGGLGDALMLSGVLKQFYGKYPGKKFKLVRRKGYTSIFRNHPAIQEIGHPPATASIITNDYWAKEDLGGNKQRAYQILARSFGLKTPVEEVLFITDSEPADEGLLKFIPWKAKNVIIAPHSESPRKSMHPMGWHILVDMLLKEGVFVLQVGRKEDQHIKNTYSVLGLTTPVSLVPILSRGDILVTCDNFIMHLAHMLKKKAVVTWGPTSREVYGYQEHCHLTAPMEHCPEKNKCLGASFADNYTKPCPLGPEHCMNKILPETIFNKIIPFIYT
ncbi:MAG: glycosyltransferase family 9 protein [Bacteroidales bacterium]